MKNYNYGILLSYMSVIVSVKFYRWLFVVISIHITVFARSTRQLTTIAWSILFTESIRAIWFPPPTTEKNKMQVECDILINIFSSGPLQIRNYEINNTFAYTKFVHKSYSRWLTPIIKNKTHKNNGNDYSTMV